MSDGRVPNGGSVRRPEPWYRFAVTALRPPVSLWFNWHFEGLENVPREGPLLVACNHISYFDPLAHGLMMLKAGRRPRFFAKQELYGNWLLRNVLEGAKQIKVERGSGSATPVQSAVAALNRQFLTVATTFSSISGLSDCSSFVSVTAPCSSIVTSTITSPVSPFGTCQGKTAGSGNTNGNAGRASVADTLPTDPYSVPACAVVFSGSSCARTAFVLKTTCGGVFLAAAFSACGAGK